MMLGWVEADELIGAKNAEIERARARAGASLAR